MQLASFVCRNLAKRCRTMSCLNHLQVVTKDIPFVKIADRVE
jgi:hypothetical protein